jgi:tetratricopeptide (TPR) repeat protein
LLGTAFYQVKDYGNSELHLSQALAIFPESKNTKHNLALIYDSNGDWTKSDKLYMELIAADSSDAQAFNNYAYSLVERGIDIEFALELAKNAIRLTPNSAPYLDTIGWIYYKLNLFDEALSYIFESLSIDGENETIQNHLEEVTKAKQNQTTPIIQQTEKQD